MRLSLCLRKNCLGRDLLPIGYPKGEVKFKHYGRNIEKLIEQAIEIEDDEEQKLRSFM